MKSPTASSAFSSKLPLTAPIIVANELESTTTDFQLCVPSEDQGESDGVLFHRDMYLGRGRQLSYREPAYGFKICSNTDTRILQPCMHTCRCASPKPHSGDPSLRPDSPLRQLAALSIGSEVGGELPYEEREGPRIVFNDNFFFRKDHHPHPPPGQ